MKKQHFLYPLLLFVTGIFSCQHQPVTQTAAVKLLLDSVVKHAQTGYASQFFDSVEMVILDGKGEWFFPNHVIQNRFYQHYSLFYDMHRRGALAVFTRSGELVLTLDKKGKGPGEYAGIRDFGMNLAEDKIFISESWKGKVHWYDLQGNWMESVDMPSQFNNIFILPDGRMLVQNQRNEVDEFDSIRLYLTDAKGAFTESVWNKPKEIDDFPQFLDKGWIRNVRNQSYYYRDSEMYDTIYRLDQNWCPQPAYLINTGSLKMPEAVATDFNTTSEERRKYLQIHRYFFTSESLVLSGFHNGWIHFEYKEAKNDLRCYDEMKDDLLGFRSIPNEPDENGRYLIQQVYVPAFKEYIDNVLVEDDVTFAKLQQQLRQILETADDNLDMILLYYRLK